MKAHISALIFPLLLCALLREKVVQADGSTIQAEVGSKVTLSCNATLKASESLLYLIGGVAVYMVRAQSLDNVMEISLGGLPSAATIQSGKGEISTGDPPSIPAYITVVIEPVTREHAGVLSCQHNGNSSVQNLEILGPPYNVTIVSATTGVKLKQKAAFNPNDYPKSHEVWTAEVDIDTPGPFELRAEFSSTPPATVSWHTGNAFLGSADSISIERDSSDLTSNEFFATARNRFGTYNVTVVIIHSYKPRSPVISETDLYPLQGEAIYAECTFDAQPTADIFYAKVTDPENDTWERIGSTMDGKLYIEEVVLERDVGKYVCVAENYLGTSHGEIILHGKPKSVQLLIGEVYGTSASFALMSHSAAVVNYTLQVNSTDTKDVIKTIERKIVEHDQRPPVINISYYLEQLEPLTDYVAQLIAKNAHGQTSSTTVNFTTKASEVTRPRVKVIRQQSTEKPINSAAMTGSNIFLLCLAAVMNRL